MLFSKSALFSCERQQPNGSIYPIIRRIQFVNSLLMNCKTSFLEYLEDTPSVFFTKCLNPEQAIFYIQKTLANNWRRSVLLNMIDADFYETQGKALTNFSQILPDTQEDLAQRITNEASLIFCLQQKAIEKKELKMP